MALNDVLDKINFRGYNDLQENEITAAFTTLYYNSPTARITLDKIADYWFRLDIKNTPGLLAAQNLFVEWIVHIDLAEQQAYRYIDESGTVRALSLERVLMHEIIHAVEGLEDEPHPDNISIENLPTLTDYRGSTVNLTNTIMAELGDTEGRVSYSGIGKSNLNIGDQLSFGESIDSAFVVGGYFDMSSSTRATNDVLYGYNSDGDTLLGGLGRDFLYGRDKNDVLTGGEGNDYINGGNDLDVAVYTGEYRDYSYNFNGSKLEIVDNRSGSPDGTDILENIEFIEFSDGSRATVGTNSVAYPGQSVLLAIDVSGSMDDDIAAVQQEAAHLVDELFGTDDAPVASRLAIITFNDAGEFRTELQFTDQQDVSARKVAALAAISQVSILGGGDEPLNGAVLSGLTGGAGVWTPGMTANRVIVFSDEPAADPELRAQVIAAATDLVVNLETGVIAREHGGSTTGNNFAGPELYNPYTPAVQTSNVSIFSVLIGSEGNDERESAALADFEELAEATGGAVIVAEEAEDTAAALEVLISTRIEYIGTDSGEVLRANVNDNIINGLGGNDTIDGFGGNDTIFGGDGSDLIYGNNGNDTLFGGRGNDTFSAGDGDDVVIDALGDSIVDTGDGNDLVELFSGFNTISGGDGSDWLSAGFQSDNISAGAGNDIIFADAGNGSNGYGSADVINGGTGDDFLMGETGADVFVFTIGDGNDVIASTTRGQVSESANGWLVNNYIGPDFEVGADTIQLNGFTMVNSDNLFNYISDSSDGAVFEAEETQILFYGIAANILSESDFIFSSL